ncbi:OmpH family outer membrane protein [Cytophagaceae bacterium YF14B1]|uniref:OmpH family outer membrane protein n=1 Tax=Xanthocytophaga flava TaxID=3048013 RepID=A0AAE3QQS2_9BACT|nr:OmpH family outer membrane protein [Xanthocytophaga flavus]MDJ1483156.1 OmpH family outer membrane protein [Xanthocytophaga flavus]
MKKTFIILASMLLALGGSIITQAQNLKIGYVDSQSVLEKLDEVKAANAQLREFAAIKDKELKKDADDFQAKVKDAEDKFQGMTPQMQAATQKELQALQEKIQIKQQSAQSEISNKEKQLFEPIQKRIQDAIKQIATDGSYTYVLDKQVLFHSPATDDLSDEVVKKLQATKPQAATTPATTKPATTPATTKPTTTPKK